MPNVLSAKHIFIGPILVLALFSIVSCGGGGTIDAKVNTTPKVSNVTITQTEEKLVGSYTYEDEQNDAEGATTYQWYRDGQAIEGATSLTYVQVLLDSRKTITLQITPIAQKGATNGAAIAASPIMGNVAPTASNATINDNNGGSVGVGDTLTAVYDYVDAEDDKEGSSTYRWMRNGQSIKDAISQSYITTLIDAGQLITFEVTPYAKTGITTGTAAIAVGVIVNSAPFASSVTITGSTGGNAKVGDTLTGSYRYTDADNDEEVGSSFRWLRNGVAITAATNFTYNPVIADAGQSISFEVTPVAATGTLIGSAVVSASIAIINNPPIASDVRITRNGVEYKVNVGDVLTGSYDYTDAENDAEGTSAFRWLRNGTAIIGATGTSYTLVSDDLSAPIGFEVTPIAATGANEGDAVISTYVKRKQLLNDTGITACGDYAYSDIGTYAVSGSGNHNNKLDCAIQPGVATKTTDGSDNDGDIIRGGQDAFYGRDVTNNDNSDGFAGFSYTKLDASGNALADQTQAYDSNPWSCVQDNVTDLIWEVKTTSGLQNTTNTYTWYNSTGINDGGRAGTVSGGNCSATGRCDTEKYTADVNSVGLCGATDWRLPNKHDLMSIVNNNQVNPAIDAAYFPNTQSITYWSSSPYAGNNVNAWGVYFYDGSVYLNGKSSTRVVRLVRGSN